MASTDGKVRLQYKTKSGVEYIWVQPVDAREILSAKDTMYTYADRVVKTPKAEVVEEKVNEFSSMKSKDLDAYVVENGIEIEGFSKMNLVQKREALVAFIAQPEVVSEPEVVKETEEDIGTDDL